MGERTFSEEQVQSLLKRATELHLMEDGDRPGLTLKDIEHIAADAGIPPKYLRAALHEADHQVSTRNNSGHTRTHVFVERTVPGELTDEEWESVVFKLRKEYGSDLAGVYGLGAQYGLGLTSRWGAHESATQHYFWRSVDFYHPLRGGEINTLRFSDGLE